jgi:endoglucanase
MRIALLLAVAVAGACSHVAVVSHPDAAGDQPDASVPPPDAGTPDEADGGAIPDASIAVDASAPVDAATPRPLPSLPLRATSRWIVDAQGKRFKLASVNWYGAESPDFVVAGLQSQTAASIARQIRSMGFNSVRLPFSNQLVEEDPVVDAKLLAAEPSLKGRHALEILDVVIEALAFEGLVVILDDHVSRADWCCSDTDGNGLWYADGYPEAAWLADWKTIVQRYRSQPAVVGVELRNELRKATVGGVARTPTWADGVAATDWRAAATRGAEAVLSANPDLLVVVEGLAYATDLTGAYNQPIQLSKPERLVWAAHDYAWFHNGTATYDQLHTDLGNQWGFLLVQGKSYTAPVWVSEFGVAHTAAGVSSDWFLWIRQYLAGADIDWAYWALNGTQATGTSRTWGAAEGYGILDLSWSQPAYAAHQSALQALQAATQGP